MFRDCGTVLGVLSKPVGRNNYRDKDSNSFRGFIVANSFWRLLQVRNFRFSDLWVECNSAITISWVLRGKEVHESIIGAFDKLLM